ncbi:D-amino acid dehydrogenase [Acinetobacter larvae]|uniref:Amino acid dehydrogenase n=1 Tax=Acinetobacter larvae TaxID=1789224 RepID=A0A1B2LVT3_9GAMM|nr:D-amino acid dehydrogenase [Acinetobacter larvae]AOA57029.1 amino acid dehydrogenase [Acinetobacter larvae]
MKKHVVVIGGGVIGLSTCYALIQAGHSVTLVEAQDAVAQQTSFANGGQLSYRYVAPLADAGVPQQALQWFYKVDSPLNFRLKCSPQQWAWLFKFLWACNRKDNIVNGEHILRLSLYSQSIMNQWREDLGDFCWAKSGKMVIHRQDKIFQKAQTGVDAQVQQILSRDETVAVEPALTGITAQICGSIYTPADETADCYQFCLRLLEKLKQYQGFNCLYQHQVMAFERHNDQIRAIQSTQARIEADEFVIAAGNGSTALFELLGIHVPLYGLKGYSLTLDFPAQQGIVPNISVTDYAHKIVYAKLKDKLRIAAMVDIGYDDLGIRPERIQALKQIVQATFPALQGLDDAVQWCGARPSTPKGPPIIGRTRYKNLWSNIGQGSLGFTLAAGSAEVLSQLISQAQPPIALDGLSMEL